MVNEQANSDSLCFKFVTQYELELNLGSILERIEQGEGPFVILIENKPELILFAWEDYWERFADCYPVGEKERIEEECRKQHND